MKTEGPSKQLFAYGGGARSRNTAPIMIKFAKSGVTVEIKIQKKKLKEQCLYCYAYLQAKQVQWPHEGLMCLTKYVKKEVRLILFAACSSLKATREVNERAGHQK